MVDLIPFRSRGRWINNKIKGSISEIIAEEMFRELGFFLV